MPAIVPWAFTTPPSRPRAPEVVLVCFARGQLRDDFALDLARFGIPSAAHAEAVIVRAVPRPVDIAWFDGWRSGALRAIAESDLGGVDGDMAVLDAADTVFMLSTAPTAPHDLSYLQAAWGLARWLVARGADIVLDAHAMTFHRGPDLAAADANAALDVRRELRMVFETNSDRPDGAHALHTRGLRKFGAPDLVALCAEGDTSLVSEVMTQLAEATALGADFGEPHHGVDLDATTTWYVAQDEHGLGELLQLGNQARVLVDGEGAHLVGVCSRVHAARSRS